MALITGITGQTGAFMADWLLSHGRCDRVVGLVRRTSDDVPERRLRLPVLRSYLLDHQLELAQGDVTDLHSLVTIMRTYRPCMVLNFAAQSHVAVSFLEPEVTMAINLGGVMNILKAVAMEVPEARVYQASTSEMFGDAVHHHFPQDEETPFEPVSPYGIAKAAAHRLMVAARNRDRNALWTVCGILFNHESEIRGERFVTRKITQAVARWAHGESGVLLELGHLDSQRDWGYAGDYVEAISGIIHQPATQTDQLQDYVVATGTTHTVREFVEVAFRSAGRMYNDREPDLAWEGAGIGERLLIDGGQAQVAISPELYRPNELSKLCGKPTKIKEDLGWVPHTSFEELVELMVEADVRLWPDQ